ncbi:hypothetical protein AX17_001537 [Amanita inopinata Kibby_2008]|nr:hypothetical protein AX17_001537 [Amanita inopinata Kibby_2008]
MNTTVTTELTTLVPSTTYTLIYALPLLLISLLLIFAGTFLTLDRTRSFAPKGKYFSTASYDLRRKKRWRWWWLEGGVGGLAAGYVFGVHFVTFIVLLVPNVSTSASLSPKAFAAVYLISACITATLAGRYKICAILFASLSSGVLTALALAVILHPPLSARLVLLAIITPLLALPTTIIGSLSPHLSLTNQRPSFATKSARFLHPLLRFCSASVGAFGAVMSLSLMLRPPATSWANIWERLWIHDGEGWGTSQEKGLSAAWCFFTCLGILCDWALRKWLGEDPDQKWDDYLSSYVEALPYSADRAGTFKPLPSLWDRLFSHKRKHEVDLFDDPSYSSLKSKPLLADENSLKDTAFPLSVLPDPFYAHTPPPLSHLKLFKSRTKAGDKTSAAAIASPHSNEDEEEHDLPPFLQKKKRKKHGFMATKLQIHNPDSSITSRTRKPVLFDADGKDDGGNSADDEKEKRPMFKSSDTERSSSSVAHQTVSSVTLIDDETGSNRTPRTPYGSEPSSLARKLEKQQVAPEYSDYEEDLTSMVEADRSRRQDDAGRRVPRFMERRLSGSPSPLAYQLARGQRVLSTRASPSPGSGSASPRIVMPGPGSQATVPLPASVPATPSLINALRRIEVAQREAYGPSVEVKGVQGMPVADNGNDNRVGVSRGWEEFWREVRVKAAESQ